MTATAGIECSNFVLNLTHRGENSSRYIKFAAVEVSTQIHRHCEVSYNTGLLHTCFHTGVAKVFGMSFIFGLKTLHFMFKSVSSED